MQKKRIHLIFGLIISLAILLVSISFNYAYQASGPNNMQTSSFDNVVYSNEYVTFEVSGDYPPFSLSDPDNCISNLHSDSGTPTSTISFNAGNTEGKCTIRILDVLSFETEVYIYIENSSNTINTDDPSPQIVYYDPIETPDDIGDPSG